MKFLLGLFVAVRRAARNIFAKLARKVGEDRPNVDQSHDSRYSSHQQGPKYEDPISKAEFAKFLHNLGADLRAEMSPLSPLHRAVWLRSKNSVRQLLQKNGVEANKQDPNGDTPLHIAAVLGDENIAAVLIQHLKDKNATEIFKVNHDGNTPIREAALNGNVDMVKFFQKNGASGGEELIKLANENA